MLLILIWFAVGLAVGALIGWPYGYSRGYGDGRLHPLNPAPVQFTRYDEPREPACLGAVKFRPRAGFTLIELLVVIVIIGIVIALTGTVVLGRGHRAVGEGARILQAALAGARDQALRDGVPAGIRLAPDPAFAAVYLPTGQRDPAQPLAASQILPLALPPDYSVGRLAVVAPSAAAQILPYPAIMVEEVLIAPGAPPTLQEPTSWFGNIRVGDKLQINGAGPWLTVVGPLVMGPGAGNPELAVNVGTPDTPSPWADTQAQTLVYPEFLFLVNGVDDNGNGLVDEGYNGLDDNGNGLVDELAEWEPEAWQGAIPTGALSYTIRRRPAVTGGGRDVALPSSVVIDLTTWSTTRERSHLPVDPTTGCVDLLVYPDGRVTQSLPYSTPASLGMDSAFYHFWLAERSDVGAPVGTVAPTLAPPAGNWWLVTVTARTGRVSSVEAPDVANPFSAAQQGGQ